MSAMRICLINYSAMSIIRVACALAFTIAACTTAAAQSMLFETNLGRAGITRTGSRFDPDDLVRDVRLRPDPFLLVRGAAAIEGALSVEGAGGNVPHACAVRSAAARGRDARVSCAPMEFSFYRG